jgi:hypothetical protein
MIRRRGWHACACLGALLMVVTSLTVPVAQGATASWEFDRSEFYFSPAPYGSGPTEPHAFTLTNTGETQLVTKTWGFKWAAVLAWIGEGPPFQVTSSQCQNRTLEPGESCSVEVAFDPRHAGWDSATLRFKTQNEEAPFASVDLYGEGTGPAIPVTPDHLTFGPVAVGTTSPPQTITLEGQSTKYAYRLEDISITPPGGLLPSSGPFQIVGGSCQSGLQLSPGMTCTIEVTMTPTEVGSFRSKLEITDWAPESPQSVELEGTATPAPPRTNDPSLTSDAGFTAGVTAGSTTMTSPKSLKRACPKGKRKVVRKGRRVCVKTARHRRHPARPPA